LALEIALSPGKVCDQTGRWPPLPPHLAKDLADPFAVSNALLMGATAAIGLIAFPQLQQHWVLLK